MRQNYVRADFALTHDVDGTLMINEGHPTVFDVDVLLPPNFVLHAEPSDNLACDNSRNAEIGKIG